MTDNKRRIIFLDYDGTLTSSRSHLAYHGNKSFPRIDINSVGLVDYLCKRLIEVDLKPEIVITSTLRITRPQTAYWNSLFQSVGALYMNVIGLTPVITNRKIGIKSENPRLRGQEVEKWMKENAHGARYVCFDDYAFEYHPTQPVIDVDATVGITVQNLRLAWETLTHGLNEPLIKPVRREVQPGHFVVEFYDDGV